MLTGGGGGGSRARRRSRAAPPAPPPRRNRVPAPRRPPFRPPPPAPPPPPHPASPGAAAAVAEGEGRAEHARAPAAAWWRPAPAPGRQVRAPLGRRPPRRGGIGELRVAALCAGCGCEWEGIALLRAPHAARAAGAAHGGRNLDCVESCECLESAGFNALVDRWLTCTICCMQHNTMLGESFATAHVCECRVAGSLASRRCAFKGSDLGLLVARPIRNVSASRSLSVRSQSTASKKVSKVVLAYSGGLDTSVILRWLQETYDCEVVTFTADLGQARSLSCPSLSAKYHLVRPSLPGLQCICKLASQTGKLLCQHIHHA